MASRCQEVIGWPPSKEQRIVAIITEANAGVEVLAFQIKP